METSAAHSEARPCLRGAPSGGQGPQLGIMTTVVPRETHVGSVSVPQNASLQPSECNPRK